MKNAAILLILMLSILGLMVGIYLDDDVCSDNSQDSSWQRIYEDNNGVLSVKLVKKEITNLSEFVT